MGTLQSIRPDDGTALRAALAAINPSKLFAPRRRPSLVARPRLLALIHGGLWRPLTLVQAPAGWGKTTLVTQWMDETPRPVAWLSLDPGDDDPLRFLGHLLASVRQLRPEVGAGLGGVAPPSRLTDLGPLLMETLIVPLAGQDDPLVIVLDDLHAVRSPVVHQAVAWLFDHLPPTVHVVVTTREEPPFPLATWRARDLLTEIRAADLAFAQAEARSFLAGAHRVELPPDVLDRLTSRTEGWAAGLQLLGLSLQQGAQADEVLDALTEDSQIGAFLVGEVLERLSPDSMDFLLRCSILDELEGALCAAVTGVDGAGERLRVLERDGLFLVALDARRRRFRFHRLFGELLQVRLAERHPDLPATLHRRAAAWFAAQGEPRRAADHAIRAGDDAQLATLVDAWATDLLDASDLGTLRGWLDRLPDGAADRLPGIGVAQGWLAVLPLRGAPNTEGAALAVRRARAALASAQAAGQALPAHRADFAGQLAAIESIATRPTDDFAGAIVHAEQALSALPEDAARPRAVLSLQIGVTHAMMGQPQRAMAPLLAAEAWGKASGNVFAAIAAMGYRAGCLTTLGRVRQAEVLCDDALAFAEGQASGLLGATAYVHAERARAHFARWDLPGALEALEQGLVRARMMGDPFPLVGMLALLARVRQAGGEEDLADEAAHEALAIAQHSGDAVLLARARTCRQGLDVQRGQARDGDIPDPAEHRAVLHDSALVATRAALAGGAPLHAAATIESFRAAAASAGRVAHALDWRVEGVVAEALSGAPERAAATLEDLLEDADRAETWCAVAERLPLLAPLLEARSTGTARLRALAGPRTVRETPRPAPAAPHPPGDLPPLPEPPSTRELEVLALVAQGLSNAEIGQALFISTGTVKTHMHRLLRKLDARNRVEAVTTAQAHGLLG
ncbi:MAG: hypothetical protein H6742_14390 [Alphaproteobacteria bacterium]|nr:hypothetical protein [Alphaproteobacteria bacterium]